MGQKVNPISFRLPLNKDWQSKWFSKKDFAKNIAEDLAIRQAIEKKFGKIVRNYKKIHHLTLRPNIWYCRRFFSCRIWKYC